MKNSYLVALAGMTLTMASANAAVLASWTNITGVPASPAGTEATSYAENTVLVSGSSATYTSEIASVGDIMTIGNSVQYSIGVGSGISADTALNLKNLHTAGNYISFTLTASSGFKIDSLDSLVLSMYRNGAAAPGTYTWEYSVNGSGTWTTLSTVASTSTNQAVGDPINLGSQGYGLTTFAPSVAISGLAADTVSLRLHTAQGVGGTSGNMHINAITLNGSTTVIPEPSTYAMLAGVAALGLVVVRRRRK